MTKKILSIDGGGIKGIIAAHILAYLESEKQKTKPEYRISDSFDLIAGTSTGAIIAMGLLIPNDQNGSNIKVKYLASELEDLYINNGNNIFETNWIKKRAAMVYDEIYEAKNLETCLSNYFTNTQLSHLVKPCLVTAYDIFNRNAFFFNSVDARKSNTHDFKVKDVARATSAAPTYFETSQIKSADGLLYTLVDGGLVANNPTACALVELIKIEKKVGNDIDINEITIVSIGTGVNTTTKKKYVYEDVKNYGQLEWASPVIDILMSASVETVDYQLKTLYESIQMPQNYCRVNPQINKASAEMDDATPQNIDNLVADAKSYIATNLTSLQQIVNIL